MHGCTTPLYIQVASSILIILAIIGIAWVLGNLFYYAAYGWAALKRKKKEGDNEQTR